MGGLKFSIASQWDSQPIRHAPVEVALSRQAGDDDLILQVEAPYFGDPGSPEGVPGQPFNQLWDYEVVEVFLLNSKDQYLEVELCPHGQHLVLMLNGSRNIIKDQLPLDYWSTINGDSWQGAARIPLTYIPPEVSRLNCYAIHGSGSNRTFEALYPAPYGKHPQPDFHRLEYFQPLDLSGLVTTEELKHSTSLWTYTTTLQALQSQDLLAQE